MLFMMKYSVALLCLWVYSAAAVDADVVDQAGP
jgi:hypothetical protein